MKEWKASEKEAQKMTRDQVDGDGSVTGHLLRFFLSGFPFLHASPPAFPWGQMLTHSPVSIIEIYLKMGYACGGQTALPRVYSRRVRSAVFSVMRGTSSGSAAQRIRPSISGGSP